MDAAIPSGAVPAAVGCGGYPDSVGSSPRSRSGSEAWDDLFPTSAAPAKLRLMCSYSGQIVPRPHDKTLCYVNGETRMVTIDRHATLAELSAKLSRSLLGGRPFTLKYQLPNEDLDSLISVTTDEDLDNMIEEYDRILSSVQGGSGGKASRLRLFLFPAKFESNSASSMGSILDDSKSETWFVDALNGAIGMGGVMSPKPQGPAAGGGGSAASSVNCLVSLDDDQSYPPPPGPEVTSPVDQNPQKQAQHPQADSSGKLIPDSTPALDTFSSFGSTSSAQSPIRVRPDDAGVNETPSGGGLEDQFSQMKVSSQKHEEILKDEVFLAKNFQPQTPVSPPIDPVHPLASSAAVTISPSESPNFGARSFPQDDVKVDIGEPLVPQLLQQPKPNASDPPPSADGSVYYAENVPPAAAIVDSVSDPRREGLYSATSTKYTPQMPPLQTYLLPVQQDQFQVSSHQQHQLQQPPQPQPPLQHPQQHYVHANQTLLHHNSGQMQMHPYYQMSQPIPSQPQLIPGHPYNQQVPMYFMPARSNLPPYAHQVQQPALGDVLPIPSSSRTAASIPNPVLSHATSAPLVTAAAPHTEFTASAANVYRTTSVPAPAGVQSSPAPQLINFGDQTQHQYMAYQPMHHHPSQTTAATNYGYEFPNPIKAQPVYYTQAPPSQFHPHYANSNPDM